MNPGGTPAARSGRLLQPFLQTFWLCLTLLICPPATAAELGLDALERRAMAQLADVQNRPDAELSPFTSDGCSGGMSHAWSWLAEVLPHFGRTYGESPPWQSCCVEHDRTYWRGETESGCERRLEADEALRSCVRAVGADRAEELSGRWGVSRKQIVQAVDAAGDLMYTAVRIGGGPCTGLSWRWGYGWPECR